MLRGAVRGVLEYSATQAFDAVTSSRDTHALVSTLPKPRPTPILIDSPTRSKSALLSSRAGHTTCPLRRRSSAHCSCTSPSCPEDTAPAEIRTGTRPTSPPQAPWGTPRAIGAARAHASPRAAPARPRRTVPRRCAAAGCAPRARPRPLLPRAGLVGRSNHQRLLRCCGGWGRGPRYGWPMRAQALHTRSTDATVEGTVVP